MNGLQISDKGCEFKDVMVMRKIMKSVP